MNINDEVMKAALVKAVTDTLTPETRQQLITQAVTNLLNEKVQPSNYNSPTKLQQAFNDAVGAAARDTAMEMVKSDEGVKAKLRQMITDAFNKLVDGDGYNSTVDKIADAIRKGVTGDRY